MKNKICLLILLALCAAAPSTYAISYVFDVALNGANEIGGGDPDGWGAGVITINPSTNEIVWDFMADNILVPLTGAHIHHAPAGVNGGVVFSFNASFSGSGINPVAQDILASPDEYYVNLHNQDYPGGAIRGQLGAPRAVPDSLGAAWGALSIGLVLIAGRRVRLSRKTAA